MPCLKITVARQALTLQDVCMHGLLMLQALHLHLATAVQAEMSLLGGSALGGSATLKHSMLCQECQFLQCAPNATKD